MPASVENYVRKRVKTLVFTGYLSIDNAAKQGFAALVGNAENALFAANGEIWDGIARAFADVDEAVGTELARAPEECAHNHAFIAPPAIAGEVGENKVICGWRVEPVEHLGVGGNGVIADVVAHDVDAAGIAHAPFAIGIIGVHVIAAGEEGVGESKRAEAEGFHGFYLRLSL